MRRKYEDEDEEEYLDNDRNLLCGWSSNRQEEDLFCLLL